MTRRSLLSLIPALPAVAVAAEPQPAIQVTHSPYYVADGDNVLSKGIQVEVACSDPRVIGYEILVYWRHDFLGKGNVEGCRTIVPDFQPYTSVNTGGDEQWIEITVTALMRSPIRTVVTVKGVK